MDRIAELRQERESLLIEAEAINNVAEGEKREYTADETKRWAEIMDEKVGLVAALNVKIADAEKIVAEKKRLSAMRLANQQPIADQVQHQAEPRINLIRTPLVAFKGENAERNAYDSGMWLRAMVARSLRQEDEQAESYCASRGFGFRATATEGTPSAGGYTVPDPLSAAFIEYRKLVGVSRRICDVMPMTSDTLTVPKMTAGQTVKYPGEATAITASDTTWAQVPLAAVKRAILSGVSAELSADSIVNFADRVVARMGYEFAKQEDNELVNGDGTSTYGGETGLLAAIGSAGVYTAPTGDDTWGELAIDDFTGTMAKLPAEHAVGAAWLVHPAFYYGVMLRVLAAASGNSIPTLEAGGVGQFLGKPVYMTDYMTSATGVSTVSALLGNFRNAVIIGDRQTLALAMSADYAFNTDVLTFRGTTRYDIAVHEPGTASVAGAFVALSTGATT